MRCTMKMYFSFFFFFLFLSTVFSLLFTFNTVNFDHTLSHRVNLLSIFFFKFFLFIIYITLAQSKRFSIFFERGVFFSFLYRTSDFYVALFEKTCIVFFFIDIFIRRFYEFFLTCTQSLTGEHLEFTISAFLFRRQRWVWWIIWIFAGTGSSVSCDISCHFRLRQQRVVPFPAMGVGVEVMASRVSMVGTKFIITSHLLLLIGGVHSHHPWLGLHYVAAHATFGLFRHLRPFLHQAQPCYNSKSNTG